MAATVTFQELYTRAMQRAYVDVTGSGGPVSLTEVKQLVNTQKRRLERRIAQNVPFFYSSNTTITTSAGASAYPLPADFAFLQSIYADEGSGRMRPLHPVGDLDRVQLIPPQAAYSILVRYTNVPAALVADDDTFDGVFGLDEWIVCRVARDIMLKKREDISAITAEIAELEREVLDTITSRDQGMPTYVTEVEALAWDPYCFAVPVVGYQVRGGNVELWSFNSWVPA